jgi:hypothetical protein
MQIQINTDSNIEGNDRLAQQVEAEENIFFQRGR